MLKTTYKLAAAPEQCALPPAWTEHIAPSGHTYYYNASTQRSTYVRPGQDPGKKEKSPGLNDHAAQNATTPYYPDRISSPAINQGRQDNSHGQLRTGLPKQQHSAQGHRWKDGADDRPKHQQEIVGAYPWKLVQTRYRRRFVHNPETNESLWKFPKHVMTAVIEMDRLAREAGAKAGAKSRIAQASTDSGNHAPSMSRPDCTRDDMASNGEEIEFEVEAKDLVDSDIEDDEDQKHAKRRRPDSADHTPIEFNEDDIAYQLSLLDEVNVHGGDNVFLASDGQPILAEADAKALFVDLLHDLNVSPFAPWDSIIADGRIVDDDRYTALPNMRARKETFDDWSRSKISDIRALREQQASLDPRVPFLQFLSDKATPKLYWAEFRRKYQKQPELKDRKLADKDKEKLYREHVARLKLPEERLKTDLIQLLKSMSPQDLNGKTSIDSLPIKVLRDIRFISLSSERRAIIIKTFIATMTAKHPAQDDTNTQEAETS